MAIKLTTGYYPITDHKGYEVEFPADVQAESNVAVSICEIDSAGQPFQGLASCRVDNVVPGDGHLRVRGEIGWDADLNCWLNWIAATET
ncbi:hypothetical protein ACF1AX_14970 [Streptomyces sp. NPDC014802]|uniref:hypothetical protein n=1 Tax=unclassified Streptomyces TaxID=2593676 RepID=UPI0036C07860